MCIVKIPTATVQGVNIPFSDALVAAISLWAWVLDQVDKPSSG